MWRRTRKPSRPAEEQAASPEAAFDVGVRLLAIRAHSRQELTRKLSRRGYAEEAVEGALDRLEGLGYIDDAAYARALVGRRSRGRGRALIAAELAAKGVARGLADAALGELDRSTQIEAATRLGRRLERSEPDPSRLLQRLLRRGFPASVAVQAVRAINGQPHSDMDRID